MSFITPKKEQAEGFYGRAAARLVVANQNLKETNAKLVETTKRLGQSVKELEQALELLENPGY
jgi:hypothetical protein